MTKQEKFLPPRRVACSRCGTEFMCSLSGPCWCSEEPVRLPMPTDGEDCLCRDCLRKAASDVADASPSIDVVPGKRSATRDP